MPAGLCAAEAQPVAAQNAFVGIRAQKFLHQRGEARLLRLFPRFHLQGFVHFRQQLAPFPVRQKAVVAHHFKMLFRHVADVAPDHLFLSQRLFPVLLRPVVVIVVHHGAAAVVPELCRRHRRSLQVPAKVFDAPPGAAGFLRKADLPVAPVLRLQVALPLLFIADMPQPGQAAGINQVIAVAQQADDRPAPDFLHRLLLKEEVEPYAVFYIQPAAGDGQVNMRMLVELAATGVQGAEDAGLHALFAGPPEHGPGGGAEEGVEQGPVVVKKRPQEVRHGKGDVLPVAVGEDVALLRHPLFGGFEAAGAAGL